MPTLTDLLEQLSVHYGYTFMATQTRQSLGRTVGANLRSFFSP
ncbi:MAG: hypothetical protein ACR2K1_02470 [Saprospiraceae bacterium]